MSRFARARGRTEEALRPVQQRLRPLRERAATAPRPARWLGSSVVLGALIALITWPLNPVGVIGLGVDGSSAGGLHLAAHHGVDFGTQLVFNYGPLGFLGLPRYSYPGLAVLGFAYVVVIQLALAISTLWAARQTFGLAIAFVVAVVVTITIPITHGDDKWSAAVVVVALIWSVAMLRDGERLPVAGVVGFALASGLYTAVQLLVKHNSGVTTFILFAITVLIAFPGRRRLAAGSFAAALAVGTALLWAAAGQSFPDFPAYLSRSGEIVTGYSSAFASDPASRRSDYVVAPLLALLLAGTVVHATAGWPRRSRIGAWVVAALFMFSAYKQGFVRHDAGHAPFFFASAIGVGLAFGWRRRAVIGAVALGLLLWASLAVTQPALEDVWHPRRSLTELRAQITTLADAKAQIAHERRELQRAAKVKPRLLSLLRGRSVHVWPEDASVVWAHPEMRWRPVPTFVLSQAYTPELDNLSAGFLSSARAPDRVLRSRQNQETKGPATTTALFCHYRELAAAGRWQVLARTGNRCGAPRLAARVETRTSRPVAIPRAGPDEIVVVRMYGLGLSLRDRVQDLLYKGPRWSVRLGAGAKRYSLAPLTAEHPMLIRIPPQTDYPPPFGMTPTSRKGARPDRLEVVVSHPWPKGGGGGRGEGGNRGRKAKQGRRRGRKGKEELDRAIRFDFYRVPVLAPSLVAPPRRGAGGR